ncbi:hypothetical protein [Chitinophaga sp.]|uniref:hypothetical protein n=1 Tax=Chitinophaga sp. TaxID=1869181 RepID=UPI0031D3CDC8
MNNEHLSEEQLQEYAMNPVANAHVQVCHHCQLQIRAYQLLYSHIKAEELPALNFNTAAFIPAQLPDVRKESRKESRYLYSLLAGAFALLMATLIACWSTISWLFSGIGIIGIVLVLLVVIAIQLMDFYYTNRKQIMHMKKLTFITLLMACPALARADSEVITLVQGVDIPTVIVRTVIVVLLFFIVSSFLLKLLKILLNHRLKSKMITMGIVGAEAERMLEKGTASKHSAVKWFFLLLSAGIGFAVTSRLPSGPLPFGILIICISLGFGAYYLYLKKQKDLS